MLCALVACSQAFEVAEVKLAACRWCNSSYMQGSMSTWTSTRSATTARLSQATRPTQAWMTTPSTTLTAGSTSGTLGGMLIIPQLHTDKPESRVFVLCHVQGRPGVRRAGGHS